MNNIISSAASSCYHFIVPNYIAQQIETIGSELKVCLESLYVGPSSYRYQGEGDDFLKKKSFYVSDNPWDLAKTLLIYGTIATVGYLLFTAGCPWIGGAFLVGAGFFAAGEIKENREGNHLKQALEKITPPFESLNLVFWDQSLTRKIIINPAAVTEPVMRGVDGNRQTVMIIFKQSPSHIKVFYFGSNLFTRSSEIKNGITIECKNVLSGAEISSLKTLSS